MTEHVRNYAIALTIALIGMFYLTTIRPGHDWGDDFSLYIRHAMNIADGVKYDQTGYIYNPYAMSYSSKTYPPVFPLLLAPVYKVFGFDILAMKVEMGLIFLIFLSVLVPLVRHRLTFASLLCLLVIFSLNPLVLEFKDSVLSDFPFLLFTYLGLLLIQKFYDSEYVKTKFFYAVILGVVAYMSYGTRSLGVVLLPSLLAYEFINWHRISARTLIAIGVFFLLAVIQIIFFHNDGNYFKIIFHNDVHSIAFALWNNLHSFFIFWDDGYHHKIHAVLFLSSMFLALSGFITQARRQALITEIFFIFYCASILIWPPFQGIRYFLPMLPLYIFYLLCGVEFWASKPIRPLYTVIRTVIFIGLLGALIFSYGSRYRHWDFRTIPEGPYKPESQELFKFIREKTPRDTVFIFRKPRALALFTGRQASIYYYPTNQEELWQYMHRVGARYLIDARPLSDHKQYLNSFIERYQKQLKAVFINKNFRVFEIVK